MQARMIGDNGNDGIIPLSMIDLLSRTQNRKKTCNVMLKLSYIEIYNESIKDLLISEDKNFDIREDPKEGIQIPGITSLTINSIVQLNTVLKVANKNRAKDSTGANQASSRSHAILIVKVECREKVQNTTEESSIGKFCLVDLAGSERASNTSNKGLRMAEGAKINKSLLVLGNCIQSLSEACEKGLKNVFIPYRGSKLTRLLKQSLGGNCRTIMIANISPFINSFQDTYNTLLYANRAKTIKNNAERNVLNVETHFSNYVNVINNLRKQNEQLKKQLKRGDEGKFSLPLIKVNESNLEIQRLQNLINTHFQSEITLMRAIHEIILKINKIGFEIYRLEMGTNFSESSKQYFHSKNSIEQLTDTKFQLQIRLQKAILTRSHLVQEIKNNQIIGQSIAPYLMSHYKEKKYEVELQELKFKEEEMLQQKKEKDRIMKFLKKQLQIRDKIIEDQKVILRKNNIVNRLTYNKLNVESQSQTKRSAQLTQKQSHNSENNTIRNHNLSALQMKNSIQVNPKNKIELKTQISESKINLKKIPIKIDRKNKIKSVNHSINEVSILQENDSKTQSIVKDKGLVKIPGKYSKPNLIRKIDQFEEKDEKVKIGKIIQKSDVKLSKSPMSQSSQNIKNKKLKVNQNFFQK